MDPLAGSSWSEPGTVAGFAQSPPNATLLAYAEDEMRRRPGLRILDLGCGAGRNAVPLARMGASVLGVDLSWPMLQALAQRIVKERLDARLHTALAPMDAIPVRTRSVDLVIAHGIWNLARGAAEFRRAVVEAARVSVPGAALFVFTFSRHTLPPHVEPVPGEPFTFTQFSGQPQCFLTADQLIEELARAGFEPDPRVPLTEHNRPRPGAPQPAGKAPVIYEGAFRFERRDQLQRPDGRAGLVV